MGRQKGNKITVSKCCFILHDNINLHIQVWKVTDGTVYAVLTPMVLSHIAVFVIKNNKL